MGEGVKIDLKLPPALAGMAAVTERLRPFAGSLVAASRPGWCWLLSVWLLDGAGRPSRRRRMRHELATPVHLHTPSADRIRPTPEPCARLRSLFPGALRTNSALPARCAYRRECRFWSLN